VGDALNVRAKDRRPRAQRQQLTEYLAFRLDTAVFAVEIERIGEILRIPPVTAVPRSPLFVMGIVGVRGRVLTVLDMRGKLRLQSPAATRHSRILVVPAGSTDPVGLFVDEVLQVHRLSDQDIEPPIRALGSEAGEHVAGITRIADTPVVVVRLEPLLAMGASSA